MKYLVLLLFSLTVLSSCLKEKTVEPVDVPVGPCSDTVSFSSEIMPQIIDMSCNTSGCHDATASGGYELFSHAQVSTNAAMIFNVINHDASVIPMPFYQNKLEDSLIQKFDCWIQQGTLDN